MCGIAGYVSKQNIEFDVLSSMASVITHRGPNAEGFYFDKLFEVNIGLAHKRLSIMDLSKNTMQVVKQNFGLVIGINSLGLMLSAIGRLPVLWGAILHNSSTIFVVSNSIRLMFFNMERGV